MAAQRSLLFFFVLVFTSLLLLAGLTLEVRSGGASDSFLSRRIEVQNEKITSSEWEEWVRWVQYAVCISFCRCYLVWFDYPCMSVITLHPSSTLAVPSATLIILCTHTYTAPLQVCCTIPRKNGANIRLQFAYNTVNESYKGNIINHHANTTSPSPTRTLQELRNLYFSPDILAVDTA